MRQKCVGGTNRIFFCSAHSCEFSWARVRHGIGWQFLVGRNHGTREPQLYLRCCRNWAEWFILRLTGIISFFWSSCISPLVLKQISVMSVPLCLLSGLPRITGRLQMRCSQSSIEPHWFTPCISSAASFLCVASPVPLYLLRQMGHLHPPTPQTHTHTHKSSKIQKGSRNKWFRLVQNVAQAGIFFFGISKIMETTKRTGRYWCHTNEVLKRMQRGYTGEWNLEEYSQRDES